MVLFGGLTAWKERTLIWLLRRVRQPYSPQLFEALAALLPIMGLEAVVLRQHEGRVEVLLTRRSDDDPVQSWAGRWHVPGTILRVKETIDQAFGRLGSKEFGVELANSHFVYFFLNPVQERGWNLQLIFVCEPVSEPPMGTWFDVDNLPEGEMILGHSRIVLEVAARWRSGEFLS